MTKYRSCYENPIGAAPALGFAYAFVEHARTGR